MSIAFLFGGRFPPAFLGGRAAAPGPSGRQLIQRVRTACGSLRTLDDRGFRARVAQLRSRVDEGNSPLHSEAVTTSAFALVNEAVRRSLGVQYYDVQFLAGRALVRGAIAEMGTGEGKTLVQALAAFAFSLKRSGVHVMTSNAYLARRDYHELSPAFQRLGVKVGLLEPGAPQAHKRQAYGADVTYGAGCEFGFDYLRDQLLLRQSRAKLGESYRQLIQPRRAPRVSPAQRGHAVAIVDEVDSVLIDEATTPLVLSADTAQTRTAATSYLEARRAAAGLDNGTDFFIQPASRQVQLTRGGVQKALLSFPKDAPLERPWLSYIEQALFAEHLLRRDVDYVVDGGQIMLVDQSTGRIFSDRTLRRGLHQAVEAKESVLTTRERSAQGAISRQQYFQLYDRLCGMTGTASGAASEFRRVYGLRVRRIPLRKPCRRVTLPMRFFATSDAKRRAIVRQVQERRAAGQPVLVGTRTIEESRRLADLLAQHGIPFQLLNGAQDAGEAEIVARAGQLEAVTIATNIAGRGTDIRLGPGVRELGGLHVVATEPHASRRVDQQLFGRSARQGDPGSFQMFVSAEDELLVLHAPRLARRIRRLAHAGDATSSELAKELSRVQRRVERKDYEKRRQMLSRDRWMEHVMATLADADHKGR